MLSLFTQRKRQPEPVIKSPSASFNIRDFSLFYGTTPVLQQISMEIPRQQVTALIGPSGCGKTSLLRALNRMNELVESSHHQGEIELDGQAIYSAQVDVAELRRRVGMVFQKPHPFPKSIYENVVFGLRVQGIQKKRLLDEVVEWALQAAALWDEVKDRLDRSALELSGGQQQRLVIARALAVRPQVLLMDEPASSLDPLSTFKIEELIHQLKADYTLVIVTHNMQQAARVADRTAFLDQGCLIEYDDTNQIFTNPRQQATEDYITGRYG